VELTTSSIKRTVVEHTSSKKINEDRKKRKKARINQYIAL